VWFPHRPDWHELVYTDGDFERVPGTLADASALAEALKLELVTTPDGSVQWDRKGAGPRPEIPIPEEDAPSRPGVP